ncbi:MAG: ATP-binding protein, partial [bacterium]
LAEQAQVAKRIEEVFRTGKAVEGGKVSYRAPNVPTHVYFIRFAPLSTGVGEEPTVMLLMDDITEQERLGAEVKRAEVHLAGVVECANDLVASLDRQGRIVSWNPAAERASGWALDKVQGRSIVDLCRPEDREAMSDILHRLALGSRAQDAEVALLGAGGQEVAIAWSSSTMRDDKGGVTGMVVVGRDLTERHQLEERLVQSDKMASLGVMAGGIAHELRNPLAVIAVSAQLLLEKWHDQAFRETCLEKIDGSTRRASLIIENLLKFARPQAEKMAAIDVGELLEATFLLLADQLVIQQVVARVESVGSGVKVRGNPGLLQQVFTNLVLNACNAMPEGGSLVASATSDRDGAVRIAFRDTGRGIPLENLPRLFDPFFTTSPPGGKFVGLGLSIAYSIVRQHAGSIEVESEPGRGSVFTVVLPRASGRRGEAP